MWKFNDHAAFSDELVCAAGTTRMRLAIWPAVEQPLEPVGIPAAASDLPPDGSCRSSAFAVIGLWSATLLLLSLVTVVCAQEIQTPGPTLASLMRQIGEAQKRSDVAGVRAIAEQAKALLGTDAGVSDKSERLREVPANVPPITKSEIRMGFGPYGREILRRRWWRVGDDPTQSDHPLRDIASIVVGCTFACRAECADKDAILDVAKSGGDYLVWAQEQAGKGLFPFPARRDGKERAFVVSERFLKKAEVEGRIDEVTRNGWLVDDLGDGGLQYDNGVCGVAVLELYRLTHDARYLKAAKQAADWAIAQPTVPNWNYNSFSIYLLSELARETGDAKYLQAAVNKAKLGLYPGQLTEGPHRGRWFDPHNAEVAYHYVIARSLVALAAALKDDGVERPQAVNALRLALEARDPEFTGGTIPDVESALEALVLLQQYLPESSREIGKVQQLAALRAVADYCVANVRAGRLPVAPSAWGRYLNYARGTAE